MAAESADPIESAWQLLLAAAAERRRGRAGVGRAAGHPWLAGEGAGPAAPGAARALLDLYAPLVLPLPGRPLTLGHLGQSLDGQIATASGDSYFVTGPGNLKHLHRLRALADAVIVGCGTVARDDPQLTVRRVEGENPVRVVLDPRARLSSQRRAFNDGAAETLVVRAEGVDAAVPAGAEALVVPHDGGRLDLRALLDALHARGLWVVFVEGGGTTVSGFLEAGLLDRLHVAIAPLVIGAGRPGLTLPARERIADCLRPQHRVFAMGGDVLFDCDLRAAATGEVREGLERVI